MVQHSAPPPTGSRQECTSLKRTLVNHFRRGAFLYGHPPPPQREQQQANSKNNRHTTTPTNTHTRVPLDTHARMSLVPHARGIIAPHARVLTVPHARGLKGEIEEASRRANNPLRMRELQPNQSPIGQEESQRANQAPRQASRS